ncbi:MAG: thymidine phosphorylase, partial [Micrococcales bacterium]|nr:thymidine phosphorylase [Micrococcales bacterium]
MATEFSAIELIIAKREKQELTTEQINWLVDNYTKGIVADEQMS